MTDHNRHMALDKAVHVVTTGAPSASDSQKKTRIRELAEEFLKFLEGDTGDTQGEGESDRPG